MEDFLFTLLMSFALACMIVCWVIKSVINKTKRLFTRK